MEVRNPPADAWDDGAAQSSSQAPAAAPPGSAAELLQELRVYQVELERQNEALRGSQAALEQSRDRYVDLYEFAPLGYLTLSADGLIVDINLTGAKLLASPRESLRQRRFAALVVTSDQGRWARHFMGVKRAATQRSIELALRADDGRLFDARLDCAPTACGADLVGNPAGNPADDSLSRKSIETP